MKKILQIVFLVMVFGSAKGQQQFELSFPFPNGIIIPSITTGYYFSAPYDSNGTTGTLLVRLDEQLNPVWQKVLVNDTAIISIQDSSGNLYGVGGTPWWSNPQNVVVIKTDSSGNTIWNKEYEYTGFNSWGTRLLSLNNSLYVLGTTEYPFSTIDTPYVTLMMKIDTSGTLHFSNSFTSSYHSNHSTVILKSHDNNLIICGSQGTLNGTEPFLYEYDSTGNGIWLGMWPFLASMGPYGESTGLVSATDSTCLYFGERADSSMSLVSFVMVYDESTGRPFKRYTFPPITEIFGIQTSDGGNAMIGIRNSLCLFKLDSNNNFQWARAYNNFGHPESILQTADGGFLITSYSSTETFVLKTDSQGLTYCNDSSINLNFQPDYDSLGNYGIGVGFTCPFVSMQHLSSDSVISSIQADTICIGINNSISEIPTPQSTLHLSPNPATSKFAISSSQFSIKQVEIYNALGEKMYSAAYREPLTVNCELFPAGIYFVTVINAKGERATEKLVLMK